MDEDISENSSSDVVAENEALRSALGECWKRLKDLEAEREGFISEGIFDLVNSLCHGVKAGAGGEQNTTLSNSISERSPHAESLRIAGSHS